ncbi:hypothetical protein M422DRAFT_56788 [Sphaerobolus stellatus SS14]|uniref:DUF2421 domain-containing protein n=1 Tax=Sphaerobolus stellatus (strain SS14) TaxID=990650 RepID=A0A0C9TNV8_SPHS4|nr:hypothetical protein M422DRAFT_56788 [Sphaerobolus stellatus SS14]
MYVTIGVEPLMPPMPSSIPSLLLHYGYHLFSDRQHVCLCPLLSRSYVHDNTPSLPLFQQWGLGSYYVTLHFHHIRVVVTNLPPRSQTTLQPYIGDQIYSLAISVVYQLSAGVPIGFAGWYIGSEDGNGNPYGITAIMALILVPIVFWRVFTPNVLPSKYHGWSNHYSGSRIFVDGLVSWMETKAFGIDWFRSLCNFETHTPQSVRKAIQIENASLIFQLSQLYGMLISEWIVVKEKASIREKTRRSSVDSRPQLTQWSSQLRKRFTKVATTVQTLRTQTSLAKREGYFRGAWPVEEYRELGEIRSEMLLYLAQLAGAVYHLNPLWRKHLLHHTKFLNPDFVSSISTVGR